MASTLAGALVVDENMERIQVAGNILAEDGAGTPVISPKGSIGTTPQKITVPANSLWCVIQSDAVMWFGENATLDGSATGKGYAIIAADVPVRIPVSRMSSFYVRAASGTIAVDFYFERLA